MSFALLHIGEINHDKNIIICFVKIHLNFTLNIYCTRFQKPQSKQQMQVKFYKMNWLTVYFEATAGSFITLRYGLSSKNLGSVIIHIWGLRLQGDRHLKGVWLHKWIDKLFILLQSFQRVQPDFHKYVKQKFVLGCNWPSSPA